MFHTFSDSAMGSSLGIADPLNGGIDIKNIGVTRKDDVARITFDEAAVRQVLEGGFNGFTPVIIGIEPLPSPVVVLR